jgi:hypothetical protein
MILNRVNCISFIKDVKLIFHPVIISNNAGFGAGDAAESQTWGEAPGDALSLSKWGWVA